MCCVCATASVKLFTARTKNPLSVRTSQQLTNSFGFLHKKNQSPTCRFWFPCSLSHSAYPHPTRAHEWLRNLIAEPVIHLTNLIFTDSLSCLCHACTYKIDPVFLWLALQQVINLTRSQRCLKPENGTTWLVSCVRSIIIRRPSPIHI